MLGGHSTFVLSNGGHIQAILNPPDNPKAAYLVAETVPPTSEEWRDVATQVPGTWWTAWHEWLAARSGPQVRARKRLGNAAHPPLDPAPGRYVHL